MTISFADRFVGTTIAAVLAVARLVHAFEATEEEPVLKIMIIDSGRRSSAMALYKILQLCNKLPEFSCQQHQLDFISGSIRGQRVEIRAQVERRNCYIAEATNVFWLTHGSPNLRIFYEVVIPIIMRADRFVWCATIGDVESCQLAATYAPTLFAEPIYKLGPYGPWNDGQPHQARAWCGSCIVPRSGRPVVADTRMEHLADGVNALRLGE